MPPLRLLLCLTLTASTALAQPPRPAPVGAKADYHVHLKVGLTTDEALRRSKADGIAYGIAVNGGMGFPVDSDAGLAPFLQQLRDKSVFVAFQGEGREWPQLFSRKALGQFDYVFTDAMTWSDDSGKRMRLWLPAEVGTIGDPEKFMDTLVNRATRIFDEEPIDLYVNSTYIPDQLQAQYDALWTPVRMKRIVDGLVKNGIGMEINNRYRIPSRAFIMLGKQAGVKFSCGTNNAGAADLGHNEYCVEMIKACGLQAANFWSPPAEGKKAVQRKAGGLR